MAGKNEIQWHSIGSGGLQRGYDCGQNIAHAGSLALGVVQTSESVREMGGAPFRTDLGLALASLEVPYLLVERGQLKVAIASVNRTSDWGEPSDPTGLHNKIMKVLREFDS